MATIINKGEPESPHLRRLRRTGYIVIAFLTLVVLILSLVQVWFMLAFPDPPAFGSIQPDAQGLPPADQRGAFLMLNEGSNPNYPGTLLQLLATTEPGVVNNQSGARLRSRDIAAVYVQTAAVSEGGDYRVYTLGDAPQEKMTVERLPSGKAVTIRPADRTWEPGAYMVDIPSEGMFGGRTYFQFYVDSPQP